MYQRQELFNIIELFTSKNAIKFYTNIFQNLNLSSPNNHYVQLTCVY